MDLKDIHNLFFMRKLEQSKISTIGALQGRAVYFQSQLLTVAGMPRSPQGYGKVTVDLELERMGLGSPILPQGYGSASICLAFQERVLQL